jgi:hypothetical protein
MRCVLELVVPNTSPMDAACLGAELAALAAAVRDAGLRPWAVSLLPANHMGNSAVADYALPPAAAGPPRFDFVRSTGCSRELALCAHLPPGMIGCVLVPRARIKMFALQVDCDLHCLHCRLILRPCTERPARHLATR